MNIKTAGRCTGSLTYHAVFRHIVILTLILPVVSTDDNIKQSTLPDVILESNCRLVHLNGFTQAAVISQDGQTYPPNFFCKVLITIHGHYLINFYFEKFDLPPPSASSYCTDGVQLFDRFGPNNVAITKRLCGSQVGFQVTSNSSDAMLVFSSDSTDQRSGFRIVYRRVVNPNPTPRLPTGSASGCFMGLMCASNSAPKVVAGFSVSVHLVMASWLCVKIASKSGFVWEE